VNQRFALKPALAKAGGAIRRIKNYKYKTGASHALSAVERVVCGWFIYNFLKCSQEHLKANRV
jgi:hypothetical protein